VPPVHLVISTDAICSANLHASSAGAASAIEPSTSSYLGKAASRVRQAHASGALGKAAKERAERAQLHAETAAQRDGAHACNTALACDRSTTGHAAGGRCEMYITGMVAAVCAHVVPGLQLAIAMFGPEEHYYYDELLTETLKLRPEVASVYLDLACHYKPRFLQVLEELRRAGCNYASEAALDARAIKLLLPWMHGFDHDLGCQLKYSGLYTVSFAHRPEHILLLLH
jgi:hypothetical protein